MQVGMLWFDNSKERDLVAKLNRAATYYQNKYGIWPTLCYVHPLTLLDQQPQIPGLLVRPSNTVLPHHFWLGVEDETEHLPAA